MADDLVMETHDRFFIFIFAFIFSSFSSFCTPHGNGHPPSVQSASPLAAERYSASGDVSLMLG